MTAKVNDFRLSFWRELEPVTVARDLGVILDANFNVICIGNSMI